MLLSIHEEGSRAELKFERELLTIGRALDNDIRLNSTQVSRYHCRIERGPEGVWLTDLGSANGTQVNGVRVDRRRLAAGDRLQVGGVRIVLEQLEPEAGAEDEELPAGLRTLTGEARAERDNLLVFARTTRELARETELAPLLRLIVDSALALVKGERGFLLLASTAAERKPGDLQALDVRLARSFDGADIPIPSSRLSLGIAHSCFEGGKPLLSVDAARDERFNGMASVEDLRLRSVMCLPIQIEKRVEGVLYVDNRLQQNAFTETDLELMELFANQAAIAIRNARRVEELRERSQRLEQSRRQIELLNEQLGRKVRDRDSQLAVVRQELATERGRYDYTAIVGASDSMRRIFQQLDRLIESELPVMIQGESGTGKELIARAIHFNGPRATLPFVTENCAALPDSLLESELFGYAKGAFTGAYKQKKGLLEQADGGTLFLDEIGDMSVEMQKKLLRVLQEGEFRPVGSDQRIQVNVRLLAASHRELDEMVREGTFREDLYYRVNVLSLRLPALRERREDIPLLAEHLLARAAREAGRPVPLMPHEVLAAIVAHDWPGNVRELENEMRRLVVLALGEVRLEHLSRSVLERRSLRAGGGPGGGRARGRHPRRGRGPREALDRGGPRRAGGNKSKAANELGISRFALQRKLEKYGLSAKGEESATPDAAAPAE